MSAENTPLHWADLVENSSELSTDEAFDIAQTWLLDSVTDSSPQILFTKRDVHPEGDLKNDTSDFSEPSNNTDSSSHYEGAPTSSTLGSPEFIREQASVLSQ